MKKIYCFGNPAIEEDNITLELADELNERFPQIEFIKCFGPDFLLNLDEKDILILDVVKGIDKVTIIEDVDRIRQTKTTTMHDFDLGTVLKLMMETGELEKVRIIGVPVDRDKNEVVNEIVDLLRNF